MKLMTYNVMLGGVEPEPSRLEKVLQVIREQNADVSGFQETKVSEGEDNAFVEAMRKSHPFNAVFHRDEDWVYGHAAALFSKVRPLSHRIIGERVRAVEMVFPVKNGSLSVSNTYLSHVSEAERLPQIIEMLQELRGNNYAIIMGDFNAMSPQDNIPQCAVKTFSPRMKEKYCRGEKICYDTIEAVLNEGYVDVGLQFFRPDQITDQTGLSGGTGAHTRPIRMDFIFATTSLLPYITDFNLVRAGIAYTASDHFPWYVSLNESLFER